MLLLIKAVDRHDTHTMALFMAPTVVNAYSKKDGTSVGPHVAMRHHAIPHPTMDTYSKKSKIAAVDNTGAKMDQAELTGIPAAVASLTPGVPDDGVRDPEFAPRPNHREVPDYLLPQVLAIVEKANRRAVKLGVDGFRVVQGEPYEKEVRDYQGTYFDGPVYGPKRYVRMIPLTIEGPTIKVPGYTLQGRVDFEDGSIIVNSRPGHELPTKFRSIRPICDHCKSDRQRNAVFVFQADAGDYMQVGRQCLKDFMGYSPEAALWAASEFGGMLDDVDRELDEGGGGGGSRSQLVDLEEVMTAAAFAVRSVGFFSRKYADEHNVSPTSANVSAYLFGKEDRSEYLKAVLPGDAEKAKAVIAWVQSEWGNKPEQSDYEYNAAELTARKAVHVRRIGLLTSLVAAYDRANEDRVAREKRVNAWVGEVGQRREFVTTFAGSNSFDTQFGVMFVMRFESPEGLLVYKGGTPDWAVDANGGKTLKAGDVIKFVGTIKEHADYKGTKQTLVSRCAAPKEKPVKVPKAKKALAVA